MKKGWMGAWLLIAGLMPASLYAQDGSPLFVQGTAFAGIERRSTSVFEIRSTTTTTREFDPGGTAGGGGFTLGTFVSRRVSVRIELDFQGSLTTTRDSRDVTGISSVPSLPGIIPAIITTTTAQHEQRDERIRDAAILVGYHTTRQHRVQLGYLGGVIFLHQQAHSIVDLTSTTVPPLIPIRSQQSEATMSAFGSDVEVGLDADVEVARHLSVVGQVRVAAFNGGLSVRPGVGFRWSR